MFPSGCEACAINLGNKNMKIDIFTGATSIRSKNIFTDISRYPIRKHEIILTLYHTIPTFNKLRKDLEKTVEKGENPSNQHFLPIQRFLQLYRREKSSCCHGKGRKHCGKRRKCWFQ